MRESGIFITFEGGEGCGKSTQIRALSRILRAAGLSVQMTREPGGTSTGEQIRSILLDSNNTQLDMLTELFLYEAARAQIVVEVIAPALSRGDVVLCDRFFDSTLAYQGYGRGVSAATIRELNRYATQDCLPDRTIVLDIDTTLGLERATQKETDRIEGAGEDFHARVRDGFHEIARLNPQRVRIVTTCEKKNETLLAIFDEMADLFPTVSRAWIAEELTTNRDEYFRKSL